MIKLVKKDYEHYLNIDTEINLNNNENFNLYSVYFINAIANPNYLDWLINHIKLSFFFIC